MKKPNPIMLILDALIISGILATAICFLMFALSTNAPGNCPETVSGQHQISDPNVVYCSACSKELAR